MDKTVPEYRTEPGAAAMERRLRSLLTAGVPVRCRVYPGLAAPGTHSAGHAKVTHTLATHLADGTTAELPDFNINPPPVLRALSAASLGRADGLGSDMTAFPRDLASELWQRVEERTRDGRALTDDERRVGSDVLLRLGYPDRAADLLGLTGRDPAGHVFSPTLAMRELAVFFRRPHDTAAVEALALRGARDDRLGPRIRLALANFVVVRNGKRGSDTAALHEAAAIGERAMTELPANGLTTHLDRQTYYRAAAFVPFVRRNAQATSALLELALENQLAGREEAERAGGLAELAWRDYAFPVHETLARTHLLQNDPERAVTASDSLVALDPNDQRAWAIRGRALLAAGRWEEAATTFARGVDLGGLPAAAAAFYGAWTAERLGRTDEARELCELSARIDPTAPAVHELAERLGLRTPAGTVPAGR